MLKSKSIKYQLAVQRELQGELLKNEMYGGWQKLWDYDECSM